MAFWEKYWGQNASFLTFAPNYLYFFAMNLRFLHFFFLLSFLISPGALLKAQMADPVFFRVTSKNVSPEELEIRFDASIIPGWHLYSTDLPSGGPTSATINFDQLEGAEPIGKLRPVGNEIERFDPIFSMDVRFFEGKGAFVQRMRLTAPAYSIKGYLQYGACDDQNCLPPTSVDFSFTGKGPQTAAPAAEQKQAASPATRAEEVKPAEPVAAVVDSETAAVADTVLQQLLSESAADSATLWAPVADKLSAFSDSDALDSMAQGSLFYVFLAGFVGGLLALLTPCVWPIIPMTVSFFLKRSGDRRKGVRDAFIYGLSIVVIYVSLGLLVTLARGGNALNELSTNAVFNIVLCLLLIVFAASFFGAFEISLPSSWSTKISNKADSTGGLLSIFLMAFTLSLVSFSCTGPIIGFLLVEVSTSENIVAPAMGMLGFALALALPFTLFALFPNWLKQMPKSGGWMNVVKVSLGFIELAFALKFLSVADLAYGWGILDREVFLAIWIVLFALLGFYLLGKIKFPHDDEDTHIGVPRFFLALASLAFAVYMVPGLFGAPLKSISAFSPPMNTQDFNLQKDEIVEAEFFDYEAGMRRARETGKPVMLDFTGYGCVNCRKMELAVWTDPEVKRLIRNDYVLISLYVDDKTPLPAPVEVEENGRKRTLRTVGDKWSYLQRTKFGHSTQPFYVLVDADGNPLSYSYSYDEDIDKYVDFLKSGLENFRK